MRTILAETLVRVQARKVASSHARCYRQVHDISVSLTDVSGQAWHGRLQTACQNGDLGRHNAIPSDSCTLPSVFSAPCRVHRHQLLTGSIPRVPWFGL